MEEQPLDKKNKISMQEIRLRKAKLKDDLDLLESGFENRISRINALMPGNLNPVKTIQKHPFKSVGIAVLFGTVAGMMTGSKSKNRGTEKDSTSTADGFASLVFGELKRVAAYRAASYISDMLENKMASKKNNSQ